MPNRVSESFSLGTRLTNKLGWKKHLFYIIAAIGEIIKRIILEYILYVNVTKYVFLYSADS